MKVFFDTSILVAAVDSRALYHKECRDLLDGKSGGVITHAIAETFSTLTGGRMGTRVSPAMAVALIKEEVWPFLAGVEMLSAAEFLLALDEAERRGLRGGAVYDFLHLAGGKKSGAENFFTLNLSHFLAFHRPGDPGIMHPGNGQ